MDGEVEERVLAIMVPQADHLVRAFRKQYESMAAIDIPAHITINHPFVPAAEYEPRLVEILIDLFSGIGAFQFALTEVRQFPAALYLAAEPEEDFRRLISIVYKRFPESPPYDGRFDEIIPHLTVVYVEESDDIAGMSKRLSTVAKGMLPITGMVTDVTLIEKIDGTWGERSSFQLARS